MKVKDLISEISDLYYSGECDNLDFIKESSAEQLGRSNLNRYKEKLRCSINSKEESIESLKESIENLKEGIERIKENIKKIENFDSKEKPVIPVLRAFDYFNVDERVFCCYYDDEEPRFAQGKVVADEYAYHKGMVAVRCDRKIHNNMEYYEGHGLTCGGGTVAIIKEWEFKYLKKHPNYLDFWIKCDLALRDNSGKKWEIIAQKTKKALLRY